MNIVEINVSEQARHIWEKLMKWVGNECAVAGLMGNMYAVSKLEPTCLANASKLKLMMTDEEYMKKYSHRTEKLMQEFVHDKAGFGIMGWSNWVSKQGLWNMARIAKAPIYDLDIQLELLKSELEAPSMEETFEALKEAKTVREASDIVLCKVMKAQNQNGAVKNSREKYSQAFYLEFHTGDNAKEDIKHLPEVNVKYVRIKRNNTAVKRAANLLARKVGYAHEGEEYKFLIPSRSGNWNCIYFHGVTAWVPTRYSEVFERTETVGADGNAVGQ